MNGPSGYAVRLTTSRQKRIARVLSALATPGRRLVPVGDPPDRYELRVPGEEAPLLVADGALVAELHRQDWLTRSVDGLTATVAGMAWLRRQQGGEDGFRAQHLAIEAGDIDAPGGAREAATVVANESPLSWLRRRKGTDGKPLISAAQFTAGERLRMDFERGRLSPRVTADWTQASSGRQRRGPGGGAADLTDTAIAARQRVDRVLDALGPDLGALLLDICCYLTGIEDAERRRNWPRRSAKVVLAIALDRLAAHYGLSDTACGPGRSGKIRHWGGEGYRPAVE